MSLTPLPTKFRENTAALHITDERDSWPALSQVSLTVCLLRIFFALPVMSGPLPAELKLRENTVSDIVR